MKADRKPRQSPEEFLAKLDQRLRNPQGLTETQWRSLVLLYNRISQLAEEKN